jgi:diguanylate cyclase
LDLTVHQLFAPSFSLFLMNDKLYKQAQYLSVTDVLTGVSNRRALMEFLEATGAGARESGEPYVVAMLDLDHFKEVNDGCGHQAGDTALELVAETIRRQCRSEDCVGRYGGEEFCLVMPNTGLDAGMGVGERVRGAVEAAGEAAAARYGGRALTISAGIAALTDPAEKHESVLARADAALYKAKQNGRNRVESAGRVESAAPVVKG